MVVFSRIFGSWRYNYGVKALFYPSEEKVFRSLHAKLQRTDLYSVLCFLLEDGLNNFFMPGQAALRAVVVRKV